MNAKKILPFLVALALGVAGVVVGRNVLMRRTNAAGPDGRLEPVLVAKHNLEPGHRLEAADIGRTSLPVEAIPPGTLRNTKDAIGRVVAHPLSKGQTLVEPALASSDAGFGLQALVLPGMRAVTIDVSESGGMIGQLFPGCRVDVLATLIDERARQTVTRTIIEDVAVIAVGQETYPSAPQEASPKQSGGVIPVSMNTRPRSVTLMVTPKQAEALELAAAKGKPRLVLRGGRDRNPVRSFGITIGELTGGDPARLIDQNSAVGAWLTALQKRLSGPGAQPSTQPATGVLLLADRKADAPPAVRRSVQLIKAGKESIKHFDGLPSTENPSSDGSSSAAVDGSK